MGIRHETEIPLLSAIQAGQAMKKKASNFYLVRVVSETAMANYKLLAHVRVADENDPAAEKFFSIECTIIERCSSVLVDVHNR